MHKDFPCIDEKDVKMVIELAIRIEKDFWHFKVCIEVVISIAVWLLEWIEACW